MELILITLKLEINNNTQAKITLSMRSSIGRIKKKISIIYGIGKQKCVSIRDVFNIFYGIKCYKIFVIICET